MATQKKSSAVPANGVKFQLTLKSSADPFGMFKNDGYCIKGMKFTGAKIAPKTCRTFKLVQVGWCADLNGVRKKLKKHGSIPEGQWREAFKNAFPRYGSYNPENGPNPIGFPDPSWTRMDNFQNRAFFPVLFWDEENGKWHSDFLWTGLGGNYRWLVRVRK